MARDGIRAKPRQRNSGRAVAPCQAVYRLSHSRHARVGPRPKILPIAFFFVEPMPLVTEGRFGGLAKTGPAGLAINLVQGPGDAGSSVREAGQAALRFRGSRLERRPGPAEIASLGGLDQALSAPDGEVE